MISTFIISEVVQLVNLVFSWLPEVTVLPVVGGVDLDNVVSTIGGLLSGLRTALPPFDTLMTALFWYYGILIALLTWSFVRWIIGLIRGSGS